MMFTFRLVLPFNFLVRVYYRFRYEESNVVSASLKIVMTLSVLVVSSILLYRSVCSLQTYRRDVSRKRNIFNWKNVKTHFYCSRFHKKRTLSLSNHLSLISLFCWNRPSIVSFVRTLRYIFFYVCSLTKFYNFIKWNKS